MNVTIEFYAKNYPYRLIFMSVRLKIDENSLYANLGFNFHLVLITGEAGFGFFG